MRKRPIRKGQIMPLDAITSAPLIIQTHAFSAIAAFALGPIALLRQRRDIWHKTAGYLWVMLMFSTALTSMFFSESPMLGPFSLIHILSVITLAGLIYALRAALRRDFITHGRAMRALYAQALIIPGVFTFLPGRRMNALFGSGQDMPVFWAALGFGALVMALIWVHPSLTRAVGLQGKGLRKIPLFFTAARR
jgi:uncharacterized membrane protein